MESSLPSGRPSSPGYPRSSPSAAGEILVDFLPPLFLPSPATMVAKMEGGGGRKSLAVTRSSSEPTNLYATEKLGGGSPPPSAEDLQSVVTKYPLACRKEEEEGGMERRWAAKEK